MAEHEPMWKQLDPSYRSMLHEMTVWDWIGMEGITQRMHPKSDVEAETVRFLAAGFWLACRHSGASPMRFSRFARSPSKKPT